MKRFLALLLVLLLALPLYAIGASAISYAPGTFSGVGQGNNGPVTVEVTFSGDAITAVKVTAHAETAGISDPAIARVPEAIVLNQSLAVDTVSGATNTSKAILEGVKAAVVAAGANPEALMVAVESAGPGEPIEETYDVVVIGGGGAGLAAAVSAADAGSSVCLIEKGAALGGNTLLAGGAYNAVDPARQGAVDMQPALLDELKSYLNVDPATCGEYADVVTTLQGQINEYLAGDTTKLFDSIELHMYHIYIGGKRNSLSGEEIHSNIDLARELAEGAPASLEWLEKFGVTWNDSISTVLGAMWPRTHSNTMSGGSGYIKPLEASALEMGATIMLETSASELIADNGRVVGVVAQKADGTPVTLHANKGVVIATGGYASNPDMINQYDEYWGGLPAWMPSTGTPNCMGDGIVMAQQVGANVVGMGFVQMMPSSSPKDGSLFSGVWASAETQLFVNQEGKRFVNEYAERDVLSKAAFEQSDKLFFIIADKKILGERDITGLLERGYVFKADTLEELAAQCGINDPAAFVAEVAKYNQYVADQHDPDFGKPLFGKPIDEPPFVATPRSPAPHHTMGGVEINTDAQVLDTNGQAIPGLFAAGEVTGGIHAGNRLGGNALADILTFGRIAGAKVSE